nr:ATPase [alpha proteobacterium AAP81b]
MFDNWTRLLGNSDLAPHGYCLLWDPALVWTHVVSDALTGLSYYSIPIAMAVFLRRRPELQFRWIAWLFVVFILACGTTHFLAIWTLWVPDYWLEGIVKALTAVVSVATAVVLWPLIPRALAMPTPAAVRRANDALTAGIAERDAALVALETAQAEREAAEAMLRQSQKMEALGQLTGGIAHDFNNLLTIIQANIARARRLSESDPRLGGALDNAMTGAERAARLTDQLLAFARRQPLRPELQDLGDIVTRITELSARSFISRVVIKSDLAADLWPVRIDAGQAENAVLNLVVNAREAMPEGGTLRLVTRNCPGTPDMVELRVIDSGIGMEDVVRERALEPFFTTKALGRGTGLGLPQVYGFVTQSGGRIAIESAPGQGTTVRLFLPRATGEPGE